MSIREISGVVIECVQGDITKQSDMNVIVNAANAELLHGGGVCGAIHRAAGTKLEEECRLYAPIQVGDVVITSAYNLPNKNVIHCLGPVYGRDEPSDVLLANCYRNALLLADYKLSESIAFPAISTGIFGYPIELATKVVLLTTMYMLPKLTRIKHIRFVLYSDADLQIYEDFLQEFVI